jgi:hypothetical protein
MVMVARIGFSVAKPYGDNLRYDLIVDPGGRLWRVQVKSTGARHHRGFAVRSSWRTSYKQMPYTEAEIDFMAVLLTDENIWYVIPVGALAGRLTIHLYPFGNRRDGRGQRMEKYREAWDLLGAGEEAGGVQTRKAPLLAKEARNGAPRSTRDDSQTR